MDTKKKLNAGLVGYQEKKRKDMLARIDTAVFGMRQNGVKITYASLARELDVHVQTMYTPYIKEHVRQFSEFNPDLEIDTSPPEYEIESLKTQLALVTDKYKKLKNANKQLKSENERLKQQYRDLAKKYQYLLGDYQQQVAAKHVTF